MTSCASNEDGPVETSLVRQMEREMRFELTTSTLARLHSTAELFPQKDAIGSSPGVPRQAPSYRASWVWRTCDQGNFTVEKSSHIASLALMSVVLSPRSTPSIVAHGAPGQQCPPPVTVHSVTDDPSAH